MLDELTGKREKLAVLGLGYVGLPLALAFAASMDVVGFDPDPEKIARLRAGEDPSGELGPGAFEGKNILFSGEENALAGCRCFVVTVPTPVTADHRPDLRALLAATETAGRALRRGGFVVYESTTYPGCTEEDCVPVLERVSGLRHGIDFKTGYSPERINPGDAVHSLSRVVKVVSGCDDEALETIAALYETIVPAGIYRAPSIRVAEAAKAVENAQRDLNIAFVNEVASICQALGIPTSDVLDAAGSKWNFLPFRPGLVGGHCTGVDPWYLAHRAAKAGYRSQLIEAARAVNDGMAALVAGRVLGHLKKMPDAAPGRVLVKGLTFKENVTDIRNSKIVDTVRALVTAGVDVQVEDPFAAPEAVAKEYGMRLVGQEGAGYHAVVIAVAHDAYRALDDEWFTARTCPGALVADLKGLYRNKIINRQYWSL